MARKFKLGDTIEGTDETANASTLFLKEMELAKVMMRQGAKAERDAIAFLFSSIRDQIPELSDFDFSINHERNIITIIRHREK